MAKKPPSTSPDAAIGTIEVDQSPSLPTSHDLYTQITNLRTSGALDSHSSMTRAWVESLIGIAESAYNDPSGDESSRSRSLLTIWTRINSKLESLNLDSPSESDSESSETEIPDPKPAKGGKKKKVKEDKKRKSPARNAKLPQYLYRFPSIAVYDAFAAICTSKNASAADVFTSMIGQHIRNYDPNLYETLKNEGHFTRMKPGRPIVRKG